MNASACALTGHRPNRFHFGYDENHKDCLKLKMVLREQIEKLVAKGVTTFYSGLALGMDTWAASTILDIKKCNPSINLHAAIPFKAQANSWSIEQQELYHELLAQCDNAVVMSEKYTRACYFVRNRYMVDNSKYLLAVYDGGKKGGTAYTTKYGQAQKRELIIIHPDTLAITEILS